jgi:hypothetical protein
MTEMYATPRGWLFYDTDVASEPVSREEYLRLERVAVGRMCRCRDCLCCVEAGLTKGESK